MKNSKIMIAILKTKNGIHIKLCYHVQSQIIFDQQAQIFCCQHRDVSGAYYQFKVEVPNHNHQFYINCFFLLRQMSVNGDLCVLGVITIIVL